MAALACPHLSVIAALMSLGRAFLSNDRQYAGERKIRELTRCVQSKYHLYQRSYYNIIM